MLSRGPKKIAPNVDTSIVGDPVLEGRCGNCSTFVKCRWSTPGIALPPTKRSFVPSNLGRDAMPWHDIPSCECPNCKARVFLSVSKRKSGDAARDEQPPPNPD